MNNVNRDTINALREFAEHLKSGRPITAYMVQRIETPDGPMHVQEPVTLDPFCLRCGEDFDDCDCLSDDA